MNCCYYIDKLIEVKTQDIVDVLGARIADIVITRWIRMDDGPGI